MKKRYTFIALVLVLMFLVLTSCGGDYKSSADVDNYGGDYKDDQLMENGTAIDKGGEIKDTTAKIIRNVVIRGESKDFDSAVEIIAKQVTAHEGYVESSEIRGGKSYRGGSDVERTAVYVLRIPSDKLDSFLAKTKGAINVTSSSETTEDVTLDYYDIESRLNTLKSKKAALEAMLEKAETLDDMLTIQENLYDVIADIEAYQSKLNLYDNKVSYSTVSLTVDEVVEYTETEPGFGDRIAKAFSGGWDAFLSFGEGFAVVMVYAFPFFVIPLVGLGVFLVIRFIRKKKNSTD